MLLESRDIYDGWSAALLEDGSFVNRWDEKEESLRHTKTSELITVFIEQQQPTGFEDEPE